MNPKSLNIRGRYFELNAPLIMGVLNVTPDSFSDAGLYQHPGAALRHAGNMLVQGAHIIDIGGASSRPGAEEVSEAEELNRVIPVIQLIKRHYPESILSLDTYRAEVARQGLDAGVDIINDITAGIAEPEILKITALAKAPYLLMHMQGTPQTMQLQPEYTHVSKEILEWLSRRILAARAQGITDVIADPGFGFGKSLEHNYTLVRDLKTFSGLGVPLAVGFSRKSMLTRLLQADKNEVTEACTVLHYKALEAGALLLRVHEVKPAVHAVKLFQYLQTLPE
jgi:dihydropteroate synthase